MTGINRRTLFKSSALVVGATALPLATASPALGVPRAPTVLATGLKIPWSLTFLPDGSALTGEKHTRAVFRIPKTGGKVAVGVVAGATKLMALAMSPSFSTDKLVYAHILTTSDARIVAMPYVNGKLGAPRLVFGGIPLGTDHAGGGLVFSPDGAYMFVSIGDLGTPSQAQVNSSFAGKILRLRPDGSIPADNPWGNAAWSKGHRNLEGMSFDAGGRLWAVEFGEDTTDELNQIVGRGNYGWPTYEGNDGGNTATKDPFVTWSPTSSCSPAGVAVRGGYAYVGALMGQCVFRVKLTTPNQKEVLPFFQGTFGRIRWVQAAPDGSVWFTTSNNEPGRPMAPTDDRVVRFLS